MSEEEARKIIDKIKQEEFPYALAIAKAYEKLQQENKHLKNILTEFEKWLEENYCLYITEIKQNSAIGKVYDKLQELKEGKK